eukprot:COSAG06_NODE_8292_length_2213_cov_1.849101_1_plen_125_part_00
MFHDTVEIWLVTPFSLFYGRFYHLYSQDRLRTDRGNSSLGVLNHDDMMSMEQVIESILALFEARAITLPRQDSLTEEEGLSRQIQEKQGQVPHVTAPRSWRCCGGSWRQVLLPPAFAGREDRMH